MKCSQRKDSGMRKASLADFDTVVFHFISISFQMQHIHSSPQAIRTLEVLWKGINHGFSHFYWCPISARYPFFNTTFSNTSVTLGWPCNDLEVTSTWATVLFVTLGHMLSLYQVSLQYTNSKCVIWDIELTMSLLWKYTLILQEKAIINMSKWW